MDNKVKNLIRTVIVIITLLFIFASTIARYISDYWWFDALGFSQIFLIGLKTKLVLFIISAVIFFVFSLINIKISSRTVKSGIPFKFKLIGIAVLSIFIGISSYAKWFVVLKYLNQVPFSLEDPIFLKDASFYVFTLPFIHAVWGFFMACVVITTIIVVLDYLQTFIINMFKNPEFIPAEPPYTTNIKHVFLHLKDKALTHLAVLGSLFFVLLSFKHYITRYSIMYSEQGIVVGAGYTDVVAFLPIITMLMILAIVVAIMFYIWIFFKQKAIRKRHILAYAIGVYFILFFIAPTVIPGVIQAFKVSPNEINLEKPYIENNIKFTRIAYGLSDVEERDFSVEMNLNQEILHEIPGTIDNIRILDWRPLIQTYKQTQEIRLYYDLSGIDIDRYMIDGKYTQVMLAPREMDQGQIVENAKTWMNLHMVYTHGYGLVMSPVNSVTKQGMPNYIIKDIPPTNMMGDEKLNIENPRIYYGEKDNNYVLVNTKTAEFDFPKGNSNEYSHYGGEGGVQLNSFTKKFIMALRFADVKILLSSDITTDSKIMFTRSIIDRVSKITPFLIIDRDPYLVINEGRLYWMVDAYSATGNFPYSKKTGGINYMRNPVKIVVDAYHGDVTYYVIDQEDPLIRTFAKIFPKEFKSFNMMPEGLKEHIRYPEDLFKIQSSIYNTYHMNDATVFYNKEDAWQIPSEIYGTGQQLPVDPYYVIMRLPQEETEEFVLMSSFTPIKKDNMIAWMAARSDKENYGKLLLYKFPKDKLIFGPLQIEAKFDQDSEISQQLTLWSQQGSRVTRGNLLVIPIKDSILYVEPLYIQAEKGQLPELKRVLVSDGERVVMEENLGLALEVLFGKAQGPRKDSEDYDLQDKSNEELIKKAQEYYDNILDSMGNDWVRFGENFDNLGEVLEELSEEEQTISEEDSEEKEVAEE